MVMDMQQQAWFIFRNLVFALYDEVAALTPRIHPQLAARADLRNSFFQREHEKQAAELYLQTEQEKDLETVVRPYTERTGLTLEDLQRAFSEGRWQNRYGAFTTGGPRWAEIARAALDLRDAIQKEDWDSAAALVSDVKRMKHNQGLLIDRFERIERYRRR